MKKWCWGLVWLLIVPCSYAQKKWTGNGITTYWNNPQNWEGEQVPDSLDRVVLDNSFLQGSYEVILPDTAVVVQSLEISPGGTATIRVLLPVTNTVSSSIGSILPRAFSTWGSGYSLVLKNNATFINASGSSSGYSLRISDSIRIENGARYIHQSRTGHADLVNQLSRATGTETGIFRMENPDAASTISISGRVFGSLELSSSASASGTTTYSGSGTNTATIRGDLLIDSGAVFSLHFNDTLHVFGNLRMHKSILNLSTGNRSSCLKLKGNLSLIEAGIQETNLSGSTGTLLLAGTVRQTVFSSGQLQDSIMVVADNEAGIQLESDLFIPFGLTLKSGQLITGSHHLELGAEASLVADYSAALTGISGAVRKQFKKEDRIQFPLIDKNVLSVIQVQQFAGTMDLSYHRQDANMEGQQLEPGISTISALEYWSIHCLPDADSPDPVFEFSYSADHSGTIQDTSALTVACYTGNQWSSVRNELVAGSTLQAGRIRTISLNRSQLQATRFSLANKTGGINILPEFIERFWVSRKSDSWIANWELAKGPEFSVVELQLSDGEAAFTTFVTVYPTLSQQHYSRTLPAYRKDVFCRLKLTGPADELHYSKSIRLPGISNPLPDKIRLIPMEGGLQIESNEAGSYLLEIFTASGQLLTQKRIYQPAGIATHRIPLPRKTNQWLLLRLSNEQGWVSTLKQVW
jgi:hypothetical protein